MTPTEALSDETLEAMARALTEHAYAKRGLTLYDNEWHALKAGCMDGMRAAVEASGLIARLGEAEAENERLKVALERIARGPFFTGASSMGPPRFPSEIALAALAGEQK